MAQSKKTKLPVLRSESAEDYLALKARLKEEIRPQGAIEEFYFDDVVALIWEIKRQRRLRISTIQSAYGPALRNLLEQLFIKPDDLFPDELKIAKKAGNLTDGWLKNDSIVKDEVEAVLGRVGLDESAIEAEAVKLSVEHLKYFDRSIALASARLDKDLRTIKDCRNSGFANRLREKSDQIVNGLEDHQLKGGGYADQKAAA